MKAAFVPLMATLFCFNIHAQGIDYLSVRDSITTLDCQRHDSASLVQSLERLRALDSNAIDTNLELYLTDLATAYWLNGARTRDLSWNHASIKVYEQLLRLNPANYSAWWNLGSQYKKVGNCTLAIRAMNKYLELAPIESIEALEPQKMFADCLSRMEH